MRRFGALGLALALVLSGCGGGAGGGWLGSSLLPNSDASSSKPSASLQGVLTGAIVLAGQTSMSEFNRLSGIKHAVFGDFFRFPECIQPGNPENPRLESFLTDCRSQGAMAMVTVETFAGLDSFTSDDLKTLAGVLRRANLPVFLRWNHEMNGSWYPWGQQPTLYIRKFRETAAVIHALAPNVAMTWTPNQGWGYPWAGGISSISSSNPDFALLDTDKNGVLNEQDDPYTPYYPGDDAVDWVGHSFYHWSNIAARGYNQIPYRGKWGQINGVDNPITNFHQVIAVAHQKPMMIAETSALFDPADRNRGGGDETSIKKNWISQVYNLTDPGIPRLDKDFPMIKAIFWFSQLKFEAEVNGQVDWRVTSNPAVASAYAEALAGNSFLKASDVITSSE